MKYLMVVGGCILLIALAALAESKYKFRIMYIDPTHAGVVCSSGNDPKITRQGALLVVECQQ